MYSPVWVHINMWARQRPEVDIQRLPLSSSFFFPFWDSLKLDLEIADWLDKLANELCGTHLPLYTQYEGYRWMLLVSGFYMGSELEAFCWQSKHLPSPWCEF